MPSLYETTAIVGDVSSSNFTTLYNSSGLSAPNTGGGAVSGNLNVGGNLTVQGTSLLQGAVTMGSTLSLPNYTFPNTDGTTYQVLTTDGSGNLTWSSVQTLPGANYTISASTATGGANLDLVSGVSTDSVKFAGGTNITVSRTDANTITISTVADNIPDGTAQGQVLYWDGSAWTANSTITSLATANRLVAEFKNTDKNLGASAVFRRNYGSSAYVENDASTVIFQIDSDSQAIVPIGTIGYKYSTTNPTLSANVSTDSFATSTEIAKINLTNIEFNGTNLYLNKNHTGAPSSNAAIIVERGSSTDATLTWNQSNDQWEFNNQVYITSGNLYLNNDVIGINQNDDAVNSYLYMKGSNKYLAWLNSANRFFLNEDTKIDGLLELQGDTLVINVDNTAVNSQIWAGTASSLIYDNVNNDWTFSDSLNVQGDLDVSGDIYVSGYQIDINSPAAGQVITFDGTKFINNSVVSATSSANRFTTEYQNSTSGVSGALLVRKNLTSTPYASGDGSSVVFQVDSNSQAVASYASVGARYDATTPSIGLSVSTDNFATVTPVAGFDAGAAELSATTLTLNSTHTGAPTQNASIIVERGSSTDANITWDETNDRWTTSNDLAIQPGATTQIALFLGDNASVASALHTTTSTSTTAVASTTRNTLTGTLSIKDTVTNALHTVSFTALRNGATAMLTTYGELYTASALATFTADIAGGSVRLLATPASSNNTTFTVVRTGIN